MLDVRISGCETFGRKSIAAEDQVLENEYASMHFGKLKSCILRYNPSLPGAVT